MHVHKILPAGTTRIITVNREAVKDNSYHRRHKYRTVEVSNEQGTLIGVYSNVEIKGKSEIVLDFAKAVTKRGQTIGIKTKAALKVTVLHGSKKYKTASFC